MNAVSRRTRIHRLLRGSGLALAVLAGLAFARPAVAQDAVASSVTPTTARTRYACRRPSSSVVMVPAAAAACDDPHENATTARGGEVSGVTSWTNGGSLASSMPMLSATVLSGVAPNPASSTSTVTSSVELVSKSSVAPAISRARSLS